MTFQDIAITIIIVLGSGYFIMKLDHFLSDRIAINILEVSGKVVDGDKIIIKIKLRNISRRDIIIVESPKLELYSIDKGCRPIYLGKDELFSRHNFDQGEISQNPLQVTFNRNGKVFIPRTYRRAKLLLEIKSRRKPLATKIFELHESWPNRNSEEYFNKER